MKRPQTQLGTMTRNEKMDFGGKTPKSNAVKNCEHEETCIIEAICGCNPTYASGYILRINIPSEYRRAYATGSN